jgi:protein-S-isoprenylcysteine O-methyltransferase Ste14
VAVFDRPQGTRASLDRAGRIGIVREFVRIGIQAVLLFAPYGGLGWRNAWLYLAMVLCFQLLLTGTLLRRNPELINVRGGVQPGGKRWDLALIVVVFLLGYSSLIVASLDAGRDGWSATAPWLVGVGVALFAAGSVAIFWSMTENTHFEGTVRIQENRDHEVCSSGPYRLVRHPGYLGMVLGNLALPLALGSRAAALPIAAAVMLLILRTALEDRTLHRELRGNAEYAASTRYRLVPGVW